MCFSICKCGTVRLHFNAATALVVTTLLAIKMPLFVIQPLAVAARDDGAVREAVQVLLLGVRSASGMVSAVYTLPASPRAHPTLLCAADGGYPFDAPIQWYIVSFLYLLACI